MTFWLGCGKAGAVLRRVGVGKTSVSRGSFHEESLPASHRSHHQYGRLSRVPLQGGRRGRTPSPSRSGPAGPRALRGERAILLLEPGCRPRSRDPGDRVDPSLQRRRHVLPAREAAREGRAEAPHDAAPRAVRPWQGPRARHRRRLRRPGHRPLRSRNPEQAGRREAPRPRREVPRHVEARRRRRLPRVGCCRQWLGWLLGRRQVLRQGAGRQGVQRGAGRALVQGLLDQRERRQLRVPSSRRLRRAFEPEHGYEPTGLPARRRRGSPPGRRQAGRAYDRLSRNELPAPVALRGLVDITSLRLHGGPGLYLSRQGPMRRGRSTTAARVSQDACRPPP